jgi:hypothetical protein
MQNHLFCSKQSDAPQNILPSSNHSSSRETHKKCIEAVAKMNITTNSCLTFKGTITQLFENQPLRSTKFIFEYIKKELITPDIHKLV